MALSPMRLDIRTSVGIAWVVAWNALFGLAFWMNGGFQPVPGRPTLIPASAACVASAIFAALIACSTRVQNLTLRPGADIAATRRGLWFIVFITAWVGVGSIVFMSLPPNG